MHNGLNESMREILDRIDAVLLRRDEESAKLWNVLTALRGPDSGGHFLKDATTCHVRARAFPRTSSEAGASGHWGVRDQHGQFIAGAIMSSKTPPAKCLSADHFSSHIASAFRALGLPVSE